MSDRKTWRTNFPLQYWCLQVTTRGLICFWGTMSQIWKNISIILMTFDSEQKRISWVERDSQGSSPTPSSSTQLSQFRNLKLRQNGCESHCTDKAFVLTESFKKPKDAAVFLASFSDQWNNYGEWLIHTQGEGIPGGWKTNNTWNKCPESDLIFVSWACNLIAKYSAIWSLSSRDNWDWNNKGVVEWELAALFEQCWVICTVPS